MSRAGFPLTVQGGVWTRSLDRERRKISKQRVWRVRDIARTIVLNRAAWTLAKVSSSSRSCGFESSLSRVYRERATCLPYSSKNLKDIILHAHTYSYILVPTGTYSYIYVVLPVRASAEHVSAHEDDAISSPPIVPFFCCFKKSSFLR